MTIRRYHDFMRTRVTGVAAALVAAAFLAAPVATRAQQSPAGYPDRPIRLIVPFGTGTASDNTARFIAQQLGERVGQPVVVDNRPGGDGVIGMVSVKSAPADGYTLVLATMTTQIGNPQLKDNLPYDPIKDFTPISGLVQGQLVLVVSGDGPYRSIDDLVAAARQNPGKLSFGSASLTSRGAAELLKVAKSFDAVNVAYKSTPAAMTDLIGGQIDFTFSETLNALPLIRSGKLRALGQTSATRMAVAPEIPTMAEAGVKDYQLTAWNGIYLRSGTPEAIIDRLNAVVTDILRAPETLEFFGKDGWQTMPGSARQMLDLQTREYEKWRRIIEAGNLKGS
ncbi:MAG: Bug family tripartite tricarboxylate transporter substrate binding protein [Lautropia sp.]